jgi:hypothetical protein
MSIKSNSATCGVQDRIFVLWVLFGLVTMQPSRPDDDVTESVLAAE